MARTTYTHRTATGELETRTSEREYTHVIVGTYRQDHYQHQQRVDAQGYVVRNDDGDIVYDDVCVASEGDQVVLTWSMSEANALRGCADKRRRAIWDLHVEAVNGGERTVSA